MFHSQIGEHIGGIGVEKSIQLRADISISTHETSLYVTKFQEISEFLWLLSLFLGLQDNFIDRQLSELDDMTDISVLLRKEGTMFVIEGYIGAVKRGKYLLNMFQI